ncbi:MAG: ABC transporter permease [Blastocatellia bacterium]
MTAEPVPRNEGAAWSDRVNPIVIKELRQAVRSRFVVAALLTLLVVQLAAMGLYLLTAAGSILDFTAGRSAFLLLYAILLAVSLLFVPLYTALRLAAERSDSNVDLLFITTIKPRSIIAGKMLAAFMLTLLIFSACTPFMTFTFFLRGIDLLSIFAALGFGFTVVLACTQMAVLLASLPLNRAFKAALGVFALIILTGFYFAILSWIGRVLFGSPYAVAAFWKTMIILLTIIVFLAGLCFAISAALTMPVAANRAPIVRLFVTGAWALVGAAAVIDSQVGKRHDSVMGWQILFNLVFAASLLAAVSERDRPGARVLRAVPRSPAKRAISFLFYSGAASGLAWTATMIPLTLGLAWGWVRLFPSRNGFQDLAGSVKWLGGMNLYFFCYALSGALLRRHLLKRIGGQWTWIISVALMILGIVLPAMVGYLLFSGDKWWMEDLGPWFVGNPFAWSVKDHRRLYFSVAGAWAVLAAAFSLPWFLERAQSFGVPPSGGRSLPDE